MKQIELLNALSKIAEEKWRVTKIMNNDCDAIRWLPLLKSKEGIGSELGVAGNGEWIFVNENGGIYAKTPGASVGWLLVLDYSLDEILEKLDLAEVNFNFFEDLPIEEILNQGLDYGNERGISKALSWIEHDYNLITPKIRVALEKICKNKVFIQKVRHAACKLAKQKSNRNRG